MKRGLPALFILGLTVIFPARVLALAINEFVAHSSQEWVEFYNDIDVNTLKTYWVDDDIDFNSDSGNSSRLLLTSLNTDNSSFPYINLTSFLNDGGDTVALFDSAGTLIDSFVYTADPGPDVSVGRDPDGTGTFIVQETASKGQPNSPTATPIPTTEPTPTDVPPTPTDVPPTPTDVPPTPTSEPTATPEPTPTDIPPTPTAEPTATPTTEPTPTDVPPTPTPTGVPSPTPTSAPEFPTVEFPGPLFSCQATFTPLRIWGFTFWVPRISCLRT